MQSSLGHRATTARQWTGALLMAAASSAPTATGRPPIEPVGRALVATAAVTGGLSLLVVFLAPAAGRGFVLVSCAVTAAAVTLAVAVVVYATQVVRQSRDRTVAEHARAARRADEQTSAGRLVTESLPALVRQLRAGASVDTALAELPPSMDDVQLTLVRTMTEEVVRVERTRAAAMSVCANAASRVQALATSMLADLREMEERHDERVLGDLLQLDHSTAQAGRLADSIAVLTGARSGRRWTKPIVMESILRGAVGRINAYQRIRVHSTSTVAVVGYAAEGVMHALAELVDNAANFSPPSEDVHVYVEEVQAGIVVTVEDAGLVMSSASLRRAEKAVSGEPLDLTMLSGTRMGLAVVGCLARKHGFTVSFRPSSRGGTGVVMMIPRQLLTEPRQPAWPAGPRIPAGTVRDAASTWFGTATTAPVPSAADMLPGTAEPGWTADGVDRAESMDREPRTLPKRRRGETLTNVPRSSPSSGSRPDRPRADAATRFGAFRQASRGSRVGRPGERVADSLRNVAGGSSGAVPSTGTAAVSHVSQDNRRLEEGAGPVTPAEPGSASRRPQ